MCIELIKANPFFCLCIFVIQDLVMTTNINKILILIVAASFLASLSYSFYFRITPVVDAGTYDKIALNILAGYGYHEDINKTALFDHAITKVGPIYEYFLASIYKIFGHYFEFVWVMQAILHGFTAWLIFLICKRIFKDGGESIGLMAAAIIGFHPDLIEISAMLMTETLYLFLIALFLWLFVLVYDTPKNLLYAGGFGLITALVILARPPVALFLPVILFFYFKKGEYKQGLFFGLMLVLVFTPWVTRNYKIYNQVIPTTLVGVHNLWVGNTEQYFGSQANGGINPATVYSEQFGYSLFSKEAEKNVIAFVIAKPLIFMKITMSRFIAYFSAIRPMGFWFYLHGVNQAIFVASSLFSILFLFVAGISGVLLAMKKNNTLFNYLIVCTVAAPLALIFAVVESRYRFQIYPFFAIFGAYFLYYAYNSWALVKKPFFYAVSFIFVISAIDIVISRSVILEHLRLF